MLRPLLPLFATAFPALPSLRTGGFRLVDERSARIVHDWDDINFSVVVVQRASGEFRAVDIDTEKRGRDWCRPPAAHAYVIPSVDSLRVASPTEVAVLTEDASHGLTLALVFAGPLVPVGLSGGPGGLLTQLLCEKAPQHKQRLHTTARDVADGPDFAVAQSGRFSIVG